MIKFTVGKRVGRIVIERAATGNAITGAMAQQLHDILVKAADSIDILTLMGEGADFTVGRDRHEPKGGTPFETFSKVSAVNKAIAAFPGILIAGVRGRAFGLGVGLVMRSDIAIAAEGTQFGLDEVAHGIPPMFIMEAIVEHLGPKRALDVVLSGRLFGTTEALDMGLLSRVVPESKLDAAVDEFVTTLHRRDPSVVLACKRYMRAVKKLPVDARPAFALVEQTQFALRKH